MRKTISSKRNNSLSCVKKKQISIGIICLIIISSLILFYSTNPKLFSLDFIINKEVNKIMQMIEYMPTATIMTSLVEKCPPTANEPNRKIINSNKSLVDNTKAYSPDNPCERIHCTIGLLIPGGRLGNRMFMFASAYGLTRTQNCRLYVAPLIRTELEDHFQMKLMDEKLWLSEEEFNRSTNIETKVVECGFSPELFQPNAFKNIQLRGYWQSYLYFDAYREEIRKIFTARNDALVRLAKYFTQITKHICPSCSPLPDTTHQQLREAFQTRYNIIWISIHIRRRDFIDNGQVSDDDYIYRAINFFRERYYQYHVRFLVASDDRNYCRQIFASEVKLGYVIILPDNFSASDDLMALSLCHHSIVTGGTFGFWSGYLAGGLVVHDTKNKIGCSGSDYYPPWFIFLDRMKEKTT